MRRRKMLEATRKRIEYGSDRDVRQLIEPRVEELYAGVIAERRIRHRNNWAGSEFDRAQATHLITAAVGSQRQADAFAHWLWIRTEDAVQLWLDEISGLAEILMRHSTLKAAEARAAISVLMRERAERERSQLSIQIETADGS